MSTLKQDIARIQELTAGAFQQTGSLTVLANIDQPDAEKLQHLLEQTMERFGYSWLHIQLNTLLPHCRYQTPEWLSDTIRRLLDEYESGGSTLPHFDQALLVIDEHCGMDGRHIFDQDNKGWKAVSNAIKGRLIPDDDQYLRHEVA